MQLKSPLIINVSCNRPHSVLFHSLPHISTHPPLFHFFFPSQPLPPNTPRSSATPAWLNWTLRYRYKQKIKHTDLQLFPDTCPTTPVLPEAPMHGRSHDQSAEDTRPCMARHGLSLLPLGICDDYTRQPEFKNGPPSQISLDEEAGTRGNTCKLMLSSGNVLFFSTNNQKISWKEERGFQIKLYRKNT